MKEAMDGKRNSTIGNAFAEATVCIKHSTKAASTEIEPKKSQRRYIEDVVPFQPGWSPGD